MNWIDKVKGSGRGAGKYDCIIGLSGGVDSSYLAHLAVNVWGLKCLAYTFDNGWGAEIAEKNVEKMIHGLSLDHISTIVDYGDFNKISKAMIMSGVPDVDIPADLALLRGTFNAMYRWDIDYYLSGANPFTEIPIPTKWSLIDDTYMMDVLSRQGIEAISIPRLKPEFYLRHVQVHTEIRPYYEEKEEEHTPDELVKDFLKDEYDWQEYGGKHCENLFTRWAIYYHLPYKFGIEKWNNYIGYGKEVVTAEEHLEVLDRLDITPEEYEHIKPTIDRSPFNTNYEFWKEHKDELEGKVPKSFWEKYVK